MGFSTHQGLVTCMRVLMGFMVGVRVVFCVVVGSVLGTCIPVRTKLILGCMAMEPSKLHIHHHGPAGRNSLVANSCCCRVIHLDRTFRLSQHMAKRVWQWGIISREVMNSAASSDSVAKAMTNLMIWALYRMAPLNQGNTLSSER
jgi:hypothetical protein